MSSFRNTWIIISAAVMIPVCALSQESMILTLEKSIAMALENNPSKQIAEKELEKAKASVWESWSVLLPSVNGSASLQHAWNIQEQTIPNFIKQMLGPDFPGVSQMPDYVRLSFGLENTFVYGLDLTQPIFLGGAGIAGIKLAGAARAASEYALASTRQNLIFETARTFYGCLLARELVMVQQEALKQAEASHAITVKKYDAGSASGFEKMRAEVEIANLTPVVIAAQNNYRVALTALKTVLGLPEDALIDVTGELEFVPDDMDRSDLQVVQEAALTHRPELLAFVQQKKMARSGVDIARSVFFPKIFFATNYSYLGMRNDFEFRQEDLSKGFTSAVSIAMPLFKGFSAHVQYQKARLDYKIAVDSEKLIHDRIMAEAEIVYNNFREAQKKCESAQESIALAEEALRLANLMYEEGASTQLDVMSSQLALRQARLNNASALFEYQVARYNLRRVTGNLHGVL